MSDHVIHPQNLRAISRRLWATPLADGSVPFVRTQQLWDMPAGLPIRKVRVAELNALDEVRWFSEGMNRLPTCRAVAEHARNIYEVDFRFPIILSPSGVVLDGMHRLCKVSWKAWTKSRRCNCRRCRRFFGGCCQAARKSSLRRTHPNDYEGAEQTRCSETGDQRPVSNRGTVAPSP